MLQERVVFSMKWLTEHKLRLLDEEGAEQGSVRIVEDCTNKSRIYDIVSVFVQERFRSKGYAEKLVIKALDFIAQQGGDVTADCSYARHVIEDKLEHTSDIHGKGHLLYFTQDGNRYGIIYK